MSIVYAVIVLVVGIAAYFGYGVYNVLVRQRKRYAKYWEMNRREAVSEDAISLVALGDSTVQAVGASSPELGTVGRVADQIRRETGREVHIDNVSVFGAKAADVVREQLGKVDLVGADIIIVAVGANDLLRKTDLESFRTSITELMAALPPKKTVVVDVAFLKSRDAYQRILDEARSARGILRGNLEKVFAERPVTQRMNAGDFFHPNDYAYTFWSDAFAPAIKRLIADRRLAK